MYALASTDTHTLTHFKCEMVTIDIHIYLHTYIYNTPYKVCNLET